jgi:hypothetical protein
MHGVRLTMPRVESGVSIIPNGISAPEALDIFHQFASDYGAEIRQVPGLDDIYTLYTVAGDVKLASCHLAVDLWIFNDKIEYQCGYTGRKTRREIDALDTVAGRLIKRLNERKIKYKYWKSSTYLFRP